MNRVDLFCPGAQHRLGPPVPDGQARGLGARSSPAPIRPSVPWPLALLGHSSQEDRCVCRKLAKAGRSIPGSGLPGPREPHLGARPTPLAPSGPLTPSCLGKPRAPALPPKTGRVRWDPTFPCSLRKWGRAGLALLVSSPSHSPSTSQEALRPLPWPRSRRLQSEPLAWWFPGREAGRERASQLPRWGGASDSSKGRWRGWEDPLPAEPALPGRDY